MALLRLAISPIAGPVLTLQETAVGEWSASQPDPGADVRRQGDLWLEAGPYRT